MRKRDQKKKKKETKSLKPNNTMKFLAVKEREKGAVEAEKCEDPLAKGSLGTEKRRPLHLP